MKKLSERIKEFLYYGEVIAISCSDPDYLTLKTLIPLVQQLEQDSELLHRLLAAGVDNWEGYSLALPEG